MTGSATILRADARALPLPDASVDLVVTSPPYWGLRSYTDGGEHYEGQIGDEPTPREYVDNLLDCTAEWMRVLKPTGSLFVNLADKFNSAASGQNGTGSTALDPNRGPKKYGGERGSIAAGVRPKCMLGLPWRYALGCVDELGLILRRDIIWHKTSALPESVTDRAATRHEYLFHLVKQERYYAAVDLIREPSGQDHRRNVQPKVTHAPGQPAVLIDRSKRHPLGRLPGSVWAIAGEPLSVPGHLGVDHFAAFPTELPRRVILGWSPSGICTVCGEGRRPVAATTLTIDRGGRQSQRGVSAIGGGSSGQTLGRERFVTVTGEACACHDPAAPTRPAVVLDPFGGTGTTALVANALGRHGISVDRSADYCRLAQWRTTDPGQLAKVLGVPKPERQIDGQIDLFAGEVAS